MAISGIEVRLLRFVCNDTYVMGFLDMDSRIKARPPLINMVCHISTGLVIKPAAFAITF
jgi:hypothetical protein